MNHTILAMLVGLSLLVIETSSAQFAQQWARIYPSPPGQFAEAVDVQMDAGGNIYTLGSVVNDMLLIKYSPAGDTLWTRRVTNGGRALKLELDHNGDLVIGGGSPGVRKYSSSGNLLWMKDVPGGVYTLSLDSADNVYAAGRDNIYTHVRKFGSNGDSLWAKEYTGIGAGSIPTASTTDAAGNFYLAALYNPSLSQGILIIKYDPNGDTAWTRVYSRLSFSEWANDIQVDNAGNIVVAGWASTGFQPAAKDYSVVKYSSTGALLWQKHFNGPGNGEDQINDIDLDGNGNVYVTGAMTAASGFVAGTVKLSSSGDSIWTSYGFDPTSQVFVDGTAGRYLSVLEPFAAILVIGILQNDIMLKTMDLLGLTRTVATYSSTQEQVLARAGLRLFSSPASAQQIPTVEVALALHRVVPFPPASSVHTVKFSSPLTRVEDESSTPGSFALHQNYPNPFNPSTTIAYVTHEKAFVSLKVFDVLGREVATLVHEERPAGTYEVAFDASRLSSGMYLYRLNAGPFSETRKLVLVK